MRYATGSTPFGDRLKLARKERGMGVHEFSKRIGVNVGMISKYENHGRQPTLSTLVSMANVLDCTLDWLCCLDDD